MKFATLVLVAHLWISACLALLAGDAVLEDVNLYAYGTNISGITIKYGSGGLAYITSTNSSDYRFISWAITSRPGTEWNVTKTATSNETAEAAGAFYIINDGYRDVGFTTNSSVADASTSRFRLYGQQVFFDDSGSLLAEFWAEAVSDGLWALKWNEAGTSLGNSVPIALKTTAPVVDASSSSA